MIAGIRWDRVGERGPVFEVGEVVSGRLERHRLRAGEPARERLDDRPLENGVLLQQPELEVRTVELDHGIPVLAFALVERRVLHVRKDRLEASALAPGPWLGELKRAILDGRGDAVIELPTGERGRAGELADDLVLARPGRKLVYATDLDDTAPNRKALIELAWRASFLYCEASFLERDAHLARASQHLTARAAGSIARAGEVERLVPFHFSKRYESELDAVYAEIADAFPGRIVTVD
jgi:ribonuclease BN (tRNA processing enzyme)